MTASTVTYRPGDPAGVSSVSRLRLYTTAERTGTPVVDIGPAVLQPDLSWVFTLPDDTADGLYYVRTTVIYTDTTTADDVTDTLTLPIPSAAQPGDPIALWVTVAELQEDSRLAAVSETILEGAAQSATDMLWALSGRQFGGKRSNRVLVLPPSCDCGGAGWTGRSDMWSAASNTWGGLGLGGLLWGWGCGCQVTIALPDHPVTSIVRVTLDGTDVDPAGYRLDDESLLVRVDGDLWPLLGSGVADEATPRLQVVYVWGREPSASGRLSARAYATEIALAAVGSSDCRLPDRVTAIVRQDLTKTFADPLQLVENGLTGLTAVDVWLRSVNPRAQTGTRPRVLSPDLPRVRSTA